jgi:ATP-dependent DNA helicase PIF1
MTQETALEILKLGENVYLTGTAGSGKTFVLSNYISYLKEEHISVGITASTGVAATHINGITLNSWAGVGIKRNLTEADLEELLKRSYLKKRILKTQILVIDEISMLPYYTLDAVDMLCRRIRQDDRPFGGIQVVFCGDFFQLPPVTTHMNDIVPENKFGFAFVYKAKVWERLNLQVCYLDREVRQKDESFLQVLHEIRENHVSKDSIKSLCDRLYKPLENISTRLYTTNADVDGINTRELAKLSGKEYAFIMKGEGNDFLTQMMKKNCLAPENLILKEGAMVMFVKNNFDKGYVNGTLGEVIGFDEKQHPVVLTKSGEQITVVPAQWVIEDDGEVKAVIKQLPLRLAWAITIHKSQGMSLDAAEIDLGKPFLPGMGYVALSRVKSLEGIRLMGLSHKALQVNEEILLFDQTLRQESRKAEKEFEKLQWVDLYVTQRLFIKDIRPDTRPHYLH